MSTQNTTAAFNQAITEGWNHETDWLWLANRVQRIEQQAVCFKRVLYINPANSKAKSHLKKLQHQMTQAQTQSFRLLIGQFARQLS